MAATSMFGSGVLWGVRTDLATPTPVNFAILQDIDFKDTADMKELHGQFEYAVEQARGKRKSTVKASAGRFSLAAMNSLFYNGTINAGYTAIQFQEVWTIPASTPYTVTVANSTTWTQTLGVYDYTTGNLLTRVTGTPTTGQYSESAGVYTFAAADEGKQVKISYKYTVLASGESLTVANQLMGSNPEFQATFYSNRASGPNPGVIALTLNACTMTSLEFKTKVDDFSMSEFEFGFHADASGNVMTWNFSAAN